MRQVRRIAFALISFITAIAMALVIQNRWLNGVLSVVSCTVFSFHSTVCAVNAISASEQVIAADTSPLLAQANRGLRNIGGIPVSGAPVPQLEVFDRAIVKFMRDRNIPAGTLAVMKNGRLLLAHGYGYSNHTRKQITPPESLMRIASVSKPITAAAIKKLMREGKISANTKVFSMLGILSANGKLGDSRLKDITIQHLLDHKGGWDREATFDPMFRSIEIASALGKRSPATGADIIAFMLGKPLQFTPGSRESYSNFGYCVLGRVIEKVTGQSYVSYIQQSILAPKGIRDIELGRTLPELRRNSREIGWYSDPGKSMSVFQRNRIVPITDGGFYLEAMDAHGGLIASSVALVQFAQNYWLTGEPRNGNGQNWIFFGSLPGTHSMLFWRPDGINIAVLFNQRTDSSGLKYDSIIDEMNRAANSIRN